MSVFEVGGRVSIDQRAFSHSPLSRSPHRLTGKVVSICDDPEITGAPEEEPELTVELDGLSHSMYGPAVLTCSSVEVVRILTSRCALCGIAIQTEEGNPWSEICEGCFEQVKDEVTT